MSLLDCPSCGSHNTIAGSPSWNAQGLGASVTVCCDHCDHYWKLPMVLKASVVKVIKEERDSHKQALSATYEPEAFYQRYEGKLDAANDILSIVEKL